jgi:hypothetical protein
MNIALVCDCSLAASNDTESVYRSLLPGYRRVAVETLVAMDRS